MERPDPSEHHPYYSLYIDRVPDGDVLTHLESAVDDTVALLERFAPDHETHRYQDDKWSVREVVGHLLDTEWTFAYRGLFMARGDPAPLPSYDQDHWAAASNANHRSLDALAAEMRALRRTTVAMFRGLPAEAATRFGIASEREFSVRSFPWIIAGHELHHRGILEDRYLPGIS